MTHYCSDCDNCKTSILKKVKLALSPSRILNSYTGNINALRFPASKLGNSMLNRQSLKDVDTIL